jgi:hypothetical protein
MMWFDRENPDVVFGDQRSETLVVTDNSRGNKTGLARTGARICAAGSPSVSVFSNRTGCWSSSGTKPKCRCATCWR